MGQAWKDAEREVAKFFGGMRRSRVSYSESVGDIIHPTYSIEVKYGSQIPNKALIGRSCKFLNKAFIQAIQYEPTKIPVVCLKKPRQRGFVKIMFKDLTNPREGLYEYKVELVLPSRKI